jgi:diacylglycerol kinase (ATP)
VPARRLARKPARTTAEKPKVRALLIINPTSGPNDDSILRVKEIVARLAAHGIKTTVRVKLSKKLARKDAKRFAKKGYPLVIAAGGDGTIAPVAEGLLGTKAALGIIPLGTYNNVATSLGIPADLAQAIALIATGDARSVDVGRVTATGANRKRIFLESATVGLTAAMMPVGQDVKSGRLKSASETLPAALQLTPTATQVYLDKNKTPLEATTLLVEIANAPRSGPGTVTSPDARMDDGALDLALYPEHTHASLKARVVALKTGLPADDPTIQRGRARRIEVRTANPHPVAADSKIVGHTPARFDALAGKLRVITGPGPGLAHQPPPEAVAAVPAPLPTEEPDPAQEAALGLAAPPTSS